MSAGTMLLVGLAGGAGSLLRYLVATTVARFHTRPLPVGIFVVNITGALALGLLTGLTATTTTLLIIGTGLLGGYTTFSTWMYESEQLAADGQLRWAAINLGASTAFGLLAVVAGRALAGLAQALACFAHEGDRLRKDRRDHGADLLSLLVGSALHVHAVHRSDRHLNRELNGVIGPGKALLPLHLLGHFGHALLELVWVTEQVETFHTPTVAPSPGRSATRERFHAHASVTSSLQAFP
jgi:CrcB protein